ncbi:persephin [Melopsittacus undulatus]|uniref:persephin n=1 Tax=Melopsittacus undulatus TaxID=13146 RepID=UPI001469B536|nr:persephin [Melopsittacus undulatus]
MGGRRLQLFRLFPLLLLLLPPPAAPSTSTPPSAPAHCALRSLRVRVRDLGLGYPSDETIEFRYCGGGCAAAPPSNHVMALSRVAPAALGAPCCRPARLEDAAFLDERMRWHRLRQVSAAGCRCVG